MNIRPATADDLDTWVSLRQALWPGDDRDDGLRREAGEILADPDQVCFLLLDGNAAAGFVEGRIHRAADPYDHVEGWYVDPAHRDKGYGADLISHLEHWCLHRAIRLLTSDTTRDYPLSPAAHARAGFKQVQQFTIFLKELD